MVRLSAAERGLSRLSGDEEKRRREALMRLARKAEAS
jgi:hypothetical protein